MHPGIWSGPARIQLLNSIAGNKGFITRPVPDPFREVSPEWTVGPLLAHHRVPAKGNGDGEPAVVTDKFVTVNGNFATVDFAHEIATCRPPTINHTRGFLDQCSHQ
jgi:hypothetical protein